MLITENFDILNILRAIEKLSAAGGGKKDAEGAEGKKPNPSAQNADEQKNKTNPADLRLTESLLARHERSVNKIKNGKR